MVNYERRRLAAKFVLTTLGLIGAVYVSVATVYSHIRALHFSGFAVCLSYSVLLVLAAPGTYILISEVLLVICGRQVLPTRISWKSTGGTNA